MKWWPRSSRSRRALIGIFFVTIAVCFIHPVVLQPMGAWLNVGGPLATPMRFGYILGGGSDTRPVTAAGLYHAGLIQQIIIPDPPASNGGRCKALSESEIVRAVLKQEGVPANAILVLDGHPASTDEEMATLAQFLRSHDNPEVAIITHDYHTRRTRRSFERQWKPGGLHKSCGLNVVSAPTDGYSAKNWWCTEDGILNYGLEFAKTLRDFLKS
jgi:uncharacterized SAM-binding protein YcdF (DUF218 family)